MFQTLLKFARVRVLSGSWPQRLRPRAPALAQSERDASGHRGVQGGGAVAGSRGATINDENVHVLRVACRWGAGAGWRDRGPHTECQTHTDSSLHASACPLYKTTAVRACTTCGTCPHICDQRKVMPLESSSLQRRARIPGDLALWRHSAACCSRSQRLPSFHLMPSQASPSAALGCHLPTCTPSPASTCGTQR